MEDESFAKQRLADASRTKDTARRLALFSLTAAAALAFLLAVAVVDYWIILPAWARVAGLLLASAAIVAGALRFRASLRQPTRLKEAALDMEAGNPAAGCELSTAAEYVSGERRPRQDYEQELATALEVKAAEHLRKLQAPYWNRSIPGALLLGGCMFAILLFVAFASGGLQAFKRAAVPWSHAPYTRVSVQPGNVEAPVGQDIDIKSAFSGRMPKAAQFAWQDEGSSQWQLASLTVNEKGEALYPLKNVRNPMSYRVSGSDAVSPVFKIDPYFPPEVKEFQAGLDLPTYARRPKLHQSGTNISALRGTTASLQVTPNVQLASAQLRFEDGQVVALKPSANGFWNTDLKIDKDARFQIELTDAKGHHSASNGLYQITAFKDEPPKVEIPDPGQDMRAEATNTVPVRISATDDYGLDEIKLVYHKLGGPEQFITAKRNGETNSEFSAEIPLSSLGLAEYELVAYHAEARDNNTLDGPGIGKSDVYFIEINNQEGGQSKAQGKSQRVNLLVIQKQIVADTTGTLANAEPGTFNELAQREKDAIDFGNIYVQNLAGRGPASAEMQAAVADMQKAQSALEKHARADALPPAESALAHLYQVLKLMPELKDLPTKPQQNQPKTNQPPLLNVVLDAIKKKKDQPDDQELAAALQQAEQLRDEQAGLNLGVQGSGTGQGNNESKMVRASNDAKDGKGQAPAKAKGGKGKGKGGKNGKGKGDGQKPGGKPADKPGEKSGEKPGEKPGDDSKEKEDKNSPEPAQEDALALAEKQSELSKEASDLAQKLDRLAGKDKRLGHNAAAGMKQAAGQMRAAAQAMQAGNMQSAGTKGLESGASLESSIAAIQRALQGRPERVDVSEEESPKEYETLIAEYLKKLSHAE